MTDEWNLNKPTNDELIPDLPGEHRERKTNVAAVLQKEHATLGDGNSGGEHKQGSAVAWYLATGSIPALDVEGNALASTDNGRFWLDSTTKILYNLDDYSDPTVAGGWLALGHLLGDIAINTDKFTVARATGDTVIDGTLDVAGYETAKGGFLDEDDMASDAADKVVSQQSIKAFAGMLPVVSRALAGYTGGESVTLPNGFIIKVGTTNLSSTDSVTFGTAFPNDCLGAWGNMDITGNHVIQVTAKGTTTFTIYTTYSSAADVTWIAVGY